MNKNSISSTEQQNQNKINTRNETLLPKISKQDRLKTWMQEYASSSRTWLKLLEILLLSQLKDQLSKNRCKDPPNGLELMSNAQISPHTLNTGL